MRNVALAVLLVGFVATFSIGRAQEMSAAQHEAAALQEEARARSAAEEARSCNADDPCWSALPSEEYRARKAAAAHRAAARALRESEAAAGAGAAKPASR